MSDRSIQNGPLRLGFLLLPDFPMIAFTSAIDPLCMASQLSGKELYQKVIITTDGQPAVASNGLRLPADNSILDGLTLDALFVCAGDNVYRAADRDTLLQLRHLASRRLALGGLCAGSYVLARAGLLDGYRFTIHWEHIAAMRQAFPHLTVSSELFVIDRDRYTVSGGTAPLDMMLSVIGQQHGPDLAAAIAENFTCERIRDRHDRQHISQHRRLGSFPSLLVEAVSLMEANIEEPLSLAELVRHLGVSRRQMQRLFQQHLNCTPGRYYLEMRLAKARTLLLETSMTIREVASACGFAFVTGFIKCYRSHFGVPPQSARRKGGVPSSVPRPTRQRWPRVASAY